jgi:hypothetical protein
MTARFEMGVIRPKGTAVARFETSAMAKKGTAQ